eukprot:758862-Alexandrium_andersonii.AAC.1
MSASLVGSEMCIRDRMFTGRNAQTVTLPSGQSELGAQNPAGWGRAPSRRCLLYTSDAADDM